MALFITYTWLWRDVTQPLYNYVQYNWYVWWTVTHHCCSWRYQRSCGAVGCGVGCLTQSYFDLIRRHVMNNLPIVLCGMYIRPLTHWGLVTHICVSNIIIIGSDNGLAPSRRQAIIWTNAAILLTGLLGTNFSEILIKVCIFSFKKMHLKMSSGKWRPFCLGLNVLMMVYLNYHWVYFTTFHRFMCV